MHEAHQEFPGTPITLIGLQVRPTRTLRSWRTMPNKPKRRLAEGSDALVVVLQHWMGPVEQVGAGVGSVGAAMAAAARARVVKSLNCMVVKMRIEAVGLVRAVVSEDLDACSPGLKYG
jgi:hypothetical protein